MSKTDNVGLDFEWKDRKNEPDIFGEICPTCGKKSWYIMKCNKCGKIFCKHCNPRAYVYDDPNDTDSTLEITCECGESTLFV